jgi:hypothetical protein
VNRHLVPGIALRAVLLEGAGNFVRIVAHRCAPSFQAEPNEPSAKLHAVRESCEQDTFARVNPQIRSPGRLNCFEALADRAKMPYVLPIEFRPNDLASPRIAR